LNSDAATAEATLAHRAEIFSPFTEPKSESFPFVEQRRKLQLLRETSRQERKGYEVNADCSLCFILPTTDRLA